MRHQHVQIGLVDQYRVRWLTTRAASRDAKAVKTWKAAKCISIWSVMTLASFHIGHLWSIRGHQNPNIAIKITIFKSIIEQNMWQNSMTTWHRSSGLQLLSSRHKNRCLINEHMSHQLDFNVKTVTQTLWLKVTAHVKVVTVDFFWPHRLTTGSHSGCLITRSQRGLKSSEY